MLLSNCNIQEFVAEQVEHYLIHTPLTFDEIKNLITSKTAIAEIQSHCIKILAENKNTDYTKVKNVLEEQALKSQIAEDDTLNKSLAKEESADNDAHTRYQRDKKSILDLIESYQAARTPLQQRLTRLVSTLALDKLQQSDAKTKKTDFKDRAQSIERLRNSIAEYSSKIELQKKRYNAIQGHLNDIRTREINREQHRHKLSERAQARAGYKSTGMGIIETLSAKNRSQLNKSIADQRKALDDRYVQNVTDAEALNFGFFMESLEKHLKELHLSAPEQEALRHCLQFMKKYLHAQQTIASIQERIKIKKQSIVTQIHKLKASESKLKNLEENTPNLNEANKSLLAQNKQLELSLDYHLKLRKHLANSSILLLALAFISSIPLILTYYGVIPFFLAPAAVFAIVSTPLALFTLATIAVGSAAWYFHAKARSDLMTMQLNVQTIKTNGSQIKKNDEFLSSLDKATIPTLEKQLKKGESERDLLIKSLTKEQELAEQVLKQAKDIKPIPYSTSLLLTSQADSQEFKDVPDELVAQEELDEMTLD